MIVDRLRSLLAQSGIVQTLRDAALSRTPRDSYGQHGEDRFILDTVFGGRSDGVYVDIGASHPIRISNTWLMYQAGWSGVTVEPLERLNRLHRKLRPRDRQISALMGAEAGETVFYSMYPSVLSTSSQSQYETLVAAGHRLVRRLVLPQMTVARLLEVAELSRIDFMSIDIEGLDVQIATQVAALPAKPYCVCIEFMDAAAEDAIRATLGPHYAHLKRLGANLIFWQP